MKTLMLLRHAKSGWDTGIPRDFDRPLNGRGQRAAQAIGRHLRSAGTRFDRVIASPAVRVKETLAGVAQGLGKPLDPQWDMRAYLASATTLLDLIRETPDSCARLLLAGHNPGLEDLALWLADPTTETATTRAAIADKLPTGSLVTLEFDVESWGVIDEAGGALIAFIRPRDLDPSLGPDGD